MHKIPLKDLIEITKDGEWGKGEPSDGLVAMAVIRGTDFASVRYGDTSNVPNRYIPEHIAKRKTLQPGDLIIETAGGTKDQPTGRTVLLKGSFFERTDTRVTCASFSRFIRVNRTKISPDYLFWFFQYLYDKGDMYRYHVQHTGVARFQYTEFAKHTLVPVPPVPAQTAIAAMLNILDEKIELNLWMNKTLEIMAREIFRDWFVDFGPVRAKAESRQLPGLAAEIAAEFSDTLDDEDKPVGWQWQPLEQFATVSTGKRPEGRENAKTADCMIPLYGGAGPMAFVREPLFTEPILMTGRVGTLGLVHRVLGPSWPSDNTIVILPKQPISCDYLYFICKRLIWWDLTADQRNHSSHRVIWETRELWRRPPRSWRSTHA